MTVRKHFLQHSLLLDFMHLSNFVFLFSDCVIPLCCLCVSAGVAKIYINFLLYQAAKIPDLVSQIWGAVKTDGKITC